MSKIRKFPRCINWSETSARNLEEASFLTFEAQGEVMDVDGGELYAGVDASCAYEWDIVAHFPLRPSWVAAGFDIPDLLAALTALLQVRRSRPIFYVDASHTFELQGRSVVGLLAEFQAKIDEPCDAAVFAKHGKT